jgi:hypothetical protein
MMIYPYLEHKKGHPKAENSTYWTAPSFERRIER